MKCPNCGQEFSGDRCPNCGWTAARSGGRTAAVIIAVFLALPCAAFGACTISIGGFDSANVKDPTYLLVIVGTLVAFVGICLWVGKLWRG